MELLPVSHGFIKHDAILLHCTEFTGTGVPVVCLHGVTGHSWMWYEVAHSLAVLQRPVWCPDLRGHGDSHWSPGREYETVFHVGDLEALLDSRGSGQVDLVGSSWGALIALSFTASHPESVRHLTLVDIEPSFDKEASVPQSSRVYSGLADVVAAERAKNPGAPAGMIEICAAMGTRPGAGGLVPKHDPFFFDQWPFYADDHWEELARVPVPTMLVHGGASFVRRPIMEQMADLLPNAALVEIEAATHVVPVDAPSPLGEHLVTFLSG